MEKRLFLTYFKQTCNEYLYLNINKCKLAFLLQKPFSDFGVICLIEACLVSENISTFSTCSELTPRAPVPDNRIPQLMQPCHPEKKKMTLFGSRTLWEWGQKIKTFCENITQLKKGNNTLKMWRLCENWHVIKPEVNVEYRENIFKYFTIGLYIL